MVESVNPFAGDLPPAEFTDVGDHNVTQPQPGFGDGNLKIAVEGGNAPAVQPLNIEASALGQGHEPQGEPLAGLLRPEKKYSVLS